MNLHKATTGEYKQIKRLYVTAFPKEEQVPFFLVKRRALQNRAAMLVAEENGAFIGFAYTVEYKDSVYLFFFAVAKEKRGCGNGGKILRLLKGYYANKIIFLAREQLDDHAPNSMERRKRHEFYLRNGFIDASFQIREATVVYDVMSTSEKMIPSDYNELIGKWAGRFILRFVKMGIVE